MAASFSAASDGSRIVGAPDRALRQPVSGLTDSQPLDIFDVAVPRDADLLELPRLNHVRYPALLETLVPGGAHGRFDILFAFPQQTISSASEPAAAGAGFLTALDRAWSKGTPRSAYAELPFTGGWLLLLGYELVGEIEPHVAVHRPGPLPSALAMRIPVALIRDRLSGRCRIVAEPGFRSEAAALRQDLERVLAAGTAPEPPRTRRLASTREPPARDYLAAVAAARDSIAAGDVYQVNLSRQWEGRLEAGASAFDLYRRLRRSNPAPFAAFARIDDVFVLSSSPERLVRVSGNQVETRPIAGTRPRSGASVRQSAQREALLASPKERAEHVMLIDLERNDLGRVCAPGSVEVSEFMVVESHEHVHHIVSNVRGTLRPGTTPGEIFRAVFPGGTITGCPKVRCMELIAALESRARGVYTGSLGYLNHDGSCDLNILIRTIVIDGDHVTFAAGSGIVADSDPARELAETRAKAKGLMLAVE